MLTEQLNKVLPLYDQYLQRKEIAENSREKYELCIIKFIEYMDIKYINPPSIIENINEEHVKSFLEFKHQTGYSIHSRDYYLKCIRYFFEFLYYEGNMKTLIMQNMDGIMVDRTKYDREYSYFTIEEMKKILGIARQEYELNKTYVTYRDYVIIVLMAYAGLTVAEIYALKNEDVDIKNNRITIVEGKKRSIYISKILKAILEEYIILKAEYSHLPFFFISAQGNQLSRRGIQTAVKNIIKDSEVGRKNKTCSSKTIRHTAIKTMVENEVELPVIANICGLDQKTLFKYIELFSSLPELKEELYLEGHPILSN